MSLVQNHTLLKVSRVYDEAEVEAEAEPTPIL